MNKKVGQETVDRNEVIKFLSDELKISLISDYCPNGLQVEGQSRISSVVSGVTASYALIEAAINLNADTVLVHHGYFWRNENACITGPKKKRIQLLLALINNFLESGSVKFVVHLLNRRVNVCVFTVFEAAIIVFINRFARRQLRLHAFRIER